MLSQFVFMNSLDALFMNSVRERFVNKCKIAGLERISRPQDHKTGRIYKAYKIGKTEPLNLMALEGAGGYL